MARKRSKYPTEQELEILKLLWRRHPLAVREVREQLAVQGRELAHTTLITTLNVMVDKGYVSREPAGRGYEFTPELSRDQVSRGMLGDLVDRVFEGSSSALLLSLLDNEQLDHDEHAEIRDAVEQFRQQQQGEHDDA